MRGKYPEVVLRAEEEDNNKDSSPNLSSNSQWDDISSVIPIFSAELIPWVCPSLPAPTLPWSAYCSCSQSRAASVRQQACSG